MIPMRTTLTALATALALTLATGVAEAQQRQRVAPPPGSPAAESQRRALQERIRERFGQIVAEQLGLDREEREALAAIVREGQEARRELREREMELRRRMAGRVSLLRRDAPVPLLTEEEAREVLEEMRAIREAERALLRREEASLLEVLTAPQLVRFYGLREALAERVRRLEQGPRGRPGGGPAGPSGTAWRPPVGR